MMVLKLVFRQLTLETGLRPNLARVVPEFGLDLKLLYDQIWHGLYLILDWI